MEMQLSGAAAADLSLSLSSWWLQVLTEQGCIFQERHGWERPGWFNRDGPAPVSRQTRTLTFTSAHARTHIYQRLSISQFSWCLSLSSPVFLSPCLCVSSSPLQVKEYDYYGVYDYKKNQNYKYKELLSREYTFDFPKHHDVVSGGKRVMR